MLQQGIKSAKKQRLKKGNIHSFESDILVKCIMKMIHSQNGLNQSIGIALIFYTTSFNLIEISLYRLSSFIEGFSV